MKKIKVFPAPHLEVIIHVTGQMIEDMKECEKLAQVPDGTGKDCGTCSWHDVEFCCTSMCELLEVWQQVE